MTNALRERRPCRTAKARSPIRALFCLSFALAIPAFPSTLSVILLGTGNPRPNPEHAGAAAAVVAGDHWFLVDAGRGVTMRLAATDLAYGSMRAVFLTHLHSDHTAGLPDVFTTSWQFGRRTPLALYGPAGTRTLSDAILQFFAYDIHIRRDLVDEKPAAGAKIETHTVHQGVVYDDGGVRVTAFLEEHPPVKPAFGYRFDSGGRSIVLSGDTRPNANLVRYAKGADILVMEAYLPGFFQTVDIPRVARRLEAYHTDALQAGAIAAAAGVKTLVLTHLIPPAAGAELGELAGRAFKGTIIVGSDLKKIDVNGER